MCARYLSPVIVILLTRVVCTSFQNLMVLSLATQSPPSVQFPISCTNILTYHPSKNSSTFPCADFTSLKTQLSPTPMMIAMAPQLMKILPLTHTMTTKTEVSLYFSWEEDTIQFLRFVIQFLHFITTAKFNFFSSCFFATVKMHPQNRGFTGYDAF